MHALFLFPVLIYAINTFCEAPSSGPPFSGGPGPDTSYISSTAQLKSNKIPDSVFRMTHLRYLSISGMDCDYGPDPHCWMIASLPAAIGNLKELISISLTLNSIKTIPREITELQNLRTIDLTDNAGLYNIDNIVNIKGLEYLYLYGCGLKQMPANIGELVNLKDLGLTGNHFDKPEQTRIKKALPRCTITF